MKSEIAESYVVTAADQAVALLHPLRAEIVAELAEPHSAAEVGRRLGETPQRVNYHLKSLEKVGLVRKVGTRQVRNLVEVLFQSIAKTFVLSEAIGMKPAELERLKDQSSLAHLVAEADRIKRDAHRLLDHAEQAETVPSASLRTGVSLPDDQARQQFLEEYVQLLERLVRKYGGDRSGDGGGDYFVVTAVYPNPEQGGKTS